MPVSLRHSHDINTSFMGLIHSIGKYLFNSDALNADPEDMKKPVIGAEVPGLTPSGESCSCSIPSISLKGLQAEDTEFIKNLDSHTFKGLQDKKPQGDLAFKEGYLKVKAERDNLDAAYKKVRQAYTVLAEKKRMAEHAQQRAAWIHFDKCRRFKKHYGMFLPCEETFRETMEIYRDAIQLPSCKVGGSIPLKPAAMLPQGDDGEVDEAFVSAVAAASAKPDSDCKSPQRQRGADFL